jgi:hypothetical protein
MLVKVIYAYDTGTNEFENPATDADVMVYINHDLSDSGMSIVTAIRTGDRRHFNWVLSEKTTVAGVAGIAERFAKGS